MKRLWDIRIMERIFWQSFNQTEEDPHAWLDLANVIKYVRTITNVLKQKDPQNASFYKDNATEYIAKLERLHQ